MTAIHVHIETVQHLHIGGGSECFPSSAPVQSPQIGRIQQIGQAPGRPPLEMLRRAVSKPCATCGGTGQITRNVPDFAGDFEVAICPVCSRERRAE